MRCDRVSELLPWFLNGSLDEEERREVSGHLDGCAACRTELVQARAAFEVFDAHLPPQVLTELVEGRPPSLPEGLLLRHLAECSDCAVDLRRVRQSRDAMESREPVRPSPEATPFEGRPRRLRRLEGWAPRLAMAASLAAVVAAAGWVWTAQQAAERGELVAGLRSRLEAAASEPPESAEWRDRLSSAQVEIDELRRQQGELAGRLEARERQQERLQRELAGATAPRLNVAVVDLFPAAAVTRGGGAEATRLERGDGRTVLILNSQAALGDDAIAVELRSSDGRTVWSRDGLRRNPTGDFTLTLPTGDLASGGYELRLVPPAGETEAFLFRLD